MLVPAQYDSRYFHCSTVVLQYCSSACVRKFSCYLFTVRTEDSEKFLNTEQDKNHHVSAPTVDCGM